jgi:hypothetical protein
MLPWCCGLTDGKPIAIDRDILDHDHGIIRGRDNIPGIYPSEIIQDNGVLFARRVGIDAPDSNPVHR